MTEYSTILMLFDEDYFCDTKSFIYFFILSYN